MQDEVSVTQHRAGPAPCIYCHAVSPMQLHLAQVLRLRAELNDKELELIELREQHVQLAVRLLNHLHYSL